MNLFYLRLFSAIALYIILPLSTQLSVVAGAVLFFGYRSFLIFTPKFTQLLGKNDLKGSFLVVILGALSYLLFEAELIAAILIAFGFSVSGFLIKNTASQTPRGSSINKVALSIGGMFSGGILSVYHNNLSHSLLTVIALIIITLLIMMCLPSINSKINRKSKSLSIQEIKKDYRPYLTWLCFGIAIGIRFFGLYVILPYYLLHTLGVLPKWYGLTFSIYAFAALLAQLYAMTNKKIVKLETALLVLAASTFILILPKLFFVEFFYGAVIWILLVALEEIYAPYLDYYAVKSDSMLMKEIGVGIGGALSVLIVNHLEFLFMIPIVSFILIGAGYFQLKIASSQRLTNNARSNRKN